MQINSEKYKTSNENMIQKEKNYNSSYSTEVKIRSSANNSFNTFKIIRNNKDNSKDINNFSRHYYNKLENINSLIDEIYPKFRENFELTNYLSYGGTGIVYEGRLKKGNNNQKLAFKILLFPVEFIATIGNKFLISIVFSFLWLFLNEFLMI